MKQWWTSVKVTHFYLNCYFHWADSRQFHVFTYKTVHWKAMHSSLTLSHTFVFSLKESDLQAWKLHSARWCQWRTNGIQWLSFWLWLNSLATITTINSCQSQGNGEDAVLCHNRLVILLEHYQRCLACWGNYVEK